MKRFSLIIVLLWFCLYGHSDIVINEVLYDAIGSDDSNEWIELYNNGTNDINLAGWVIQSGGVSYIEVYTFPSITIRAGSFFLISESPHTLANIVTELGFENSGTATDGIRIINPTSHYRDTILYGLPNINNLAGDDINQLPCNSVIPGRSLARTNNGVDTNSPDDWFSCENPSPGYSNIIERTVTLSNSEANTNGTGISVSTVILNLSTWKVDNPDLSIKILFNSELKYFEDLITIPALDSLNLCITIENKFLLSGLLEIELINNGNIQIVDNLWRKWINYETPTIFLSEIMYYPLVSQTEWIEVKLLTDVTDCAISIYDATGNEANSKISGSPGDYIVIAEDRENTLDTFPACDSLKVFQADGWSHLNNSGDLVIIKHLQTTLDSLVYEANSTPAGYSWEYSEINNVWKRSNSPDGATPTTVDSVAEDNPSTQLSGLKIVNDLISLKKDTQLEIQFNSQKLVHFLDIQLFDLRGKELNTLTTNFSNQYSGEYHWDGHLKGRYLTSGLYPAIVKIKAENGRVIEEKKILITINR